MRQTFIATGLVFMLLAAGASAGIFDFLTHKQTVEQGTPATFFADVKVEVNEKFSVNYLEFEIVDKDGSVSVCRFAEVGTKLSDCEGVLSIDPIEDRDNGRWGYGYNFGAKKSMYKITVATDDLLGDYKARLSANIKTKKATKDFKSGWFSFDVVEMLKRIAPKKTR